MKIEVDGIVLDLLVGADPEIFVTAGGKPVSAHGLVPGTKEVPHKVDGGAIQVDGMALEFNIDPATSATEFVANVTKVMGQLTSRLPQGMALSSLATANFGSAYIKAQPPVAQELGCSADYNAYTGKANPKPNVDAPFRTAAGHVHIGWTQHADNEADSFKELCNEFTKVLDLYLGVPSVLKDPDVKRRELYGQAGAYRSKSYGLEYRVLSNFWLTSKSEMEWVYRQTAEALRKFLGGFRMNDARVVSCINNSDKALASTLLQEYPNV